MTSPTPQSILKTVFGFDTFRPLQQAVIENVLKKRDTLVIMPTGGGKSLCYQIPALLFPGLTVVVSPLIALMKDQVEQMQAAGVEALFLNSSLSFEEYQENMERVRSGRVKLLYVAPETLLTPRLFALLDSVPLDCLTIDEAHCISEWGHDFRPEYRQLVGVRRRYPQAVCLALTATATVQVREDIQLTLGFEIANEFIASFNRENLFLEVERKEAPAEQLLEFLKRFKDQAGIIYCFSRKQVDDLAQFLTRKGYTARPYHAGLEDEERKLNQDLFVKDDIQIIVATIAFGMGINKPNVRFVVHYDLPKTMEGYYQEIGRAGRDGLPAHCLLLFGRGDIIKLRYFIDAKEPEEREVAYQQLNALVRYADNPGCRRVPLLAYFGEQYTSSNCGMCDNCTQVEQAQVDITVPAQKFLSCVARTGERFGAGHIIDILLGSNNKKIIDYRHHLLTTFGIGKELSRSQWQHLARQLVHQGLLEQGPGQYATLNLTGQAYEVLKNRVPIFGTLEERAPAYPSSEKGGELRYEAELYEILRRKRKELADSEHVPPYIIFSDKTLIEMAAYLPASRDSLMKINGVGTVKAERFGATFLELIAEFSQQHHLSEKTKPRPARQSETTGPRRANRSEDTVGTARFVVVGEAYNRGKSIATLMEEYAVQQGTILDHLAEYVLHGHALRAGSDLASLSALSPEARQAVAMAYGELGTERLKPVYERLNGGVTYDELKIMRLIYLANKKGG